MACSGRGIPLPSGVCECEDGWTTFGDLQPVVGFGCDVSTVFVRVISALGLMLSLIWLALLAKNLVELATQSHAGGTNKTIITVLKGAGFCSALCYLAFFIIRLVDPSRALTVDETVSWLYFLSTVFTSVTVVIGVHLVVMISMSQERFSSNKSFLILLGRLKCLAPSAQLGITIAVFLMPLTVYARRSSADAADRLVLASLAGVFACPVSLAVMIVIILRPALRDLGSLAHRAKGKPDGSSEAREFNKVVSRLQKLRLVSIAVGMSCFVLFPVLVSSSIRYWSPYFYSGILLIIPSFGIQLAILFTTRLRRSGESENSSKGALEAGSKDSAPSFRMRSSDRNPVESATSPKIAKSGILVTPAN